ncbi:malto-oligosyltrehalose synthase [Lichenibacterium dinghuense]|uniref:malto-oligosyltrehalose synthase n=1 Tax=Lichenibacterium dinghuense TaxID=2895977 RepID=UPI001EFF87C5|nr:malto-oligosyltrehalose synthase [Lichenibacterium sp. 6Y81]
MTPRATYRLQFTPDFGFDAAADLAPYLAKLGVSHLYASPYFKARPGSTHGYDITDHNVFNPELGGAQAFARMSAALKKAGLKQIVDFVPNHMGVGGADNPFWLDVLEWGRDSAYAGWFDIDWDSEQSYLQDKLLVPILGGQYGVELADGKLALKFDAKTGSFAVWAYDTHMLPVCPVHYGQILGDDDETLDRIGDGFSGLPNWRPQVLRRAEGLKAELVELVRERPEIAEAIGAAVARMNGTPGEPKSWARLDRLIAKQSWRAAQFRTAADDINYRRFFNINDLAGLRMELPAVFDTTHRLVATMLRDGTIDGLRIDHIDGLLDPEGYLKRLRARAPDRQGQAPYLVVEKILGPGEPLRPGWPVDGTTGYEVTNQLLELMVDPANEASFSRIYADFAGEAEVFAKTLRASKKLIMDNEMSSELNSLAREITRIARHNPKTSDFTRNIIRRALREVVANFPVYRTYLDFDGRPTEADRQSLDTAVSAARRSLGAVDGSVFTFLYDLLTGDLVAGPKSGLSRNAVLHAAMRFQQYTGPVTAKGLEDTAFYRFNRFIALNEVGGHPSTFGRPLQAFHDANAERAEHWPHAMLTTSTHDTKRGEDTRARLAALSEFPDAWAEAATAWGKLLSPAPADADPDRQPDRNDEYALLQLVVGTCPVELLDGERDPEAVKAFADRIKAAMTKSMREAKVHSTWSDPNEAYEGATLAFVDRMLTGERSEAFWSASLPFIRHVAKLGAQNSVVQTVLKLTIPGMPDIYQGCELWDFSMVDPDNRRPVDFAARAAALDAAEADMARGRAEALASYAETWRDGRLKLALTTALLELRRDHAALFADGSYEAVAATGPGADAVCAFRRQAGADEAVVAVARFPGRREASGFDGATALPLPAGRWTDALTGRSFEGGSVGAGKLFAAIPAAVLIREG